MQRSGFANGRAQLDTAEHLGLLLGCRLDIEVHLQGGVLEVGANVHTRDVLTVGDLIADFFEMPLQICCAVTIPPDSARHSELKNYPMRHCYLPPLEKEPVASYYHSGSPSTLSHYEYLMTHLE